MKNKELFDKTVGILVKSYMNNTLNHGDCSACAVGNLVCESMYEGDREAWLHAMQMNGPFENWNEVFCTDSDLQVQEFNIDKYKTSWCAQEQIDSTGYTPQELARIEYTFECANPSDYSGDLEEKDGFTFPKSLKTKDQAMFDGLLAVYDELCDIHEVTAEDNVPAGELVFCK